MFLFLLILLFSFLFSFLPFWAFNLQHFVRYYGLSFFLPLGLSIILPFDFAFHVPSY